MNAATPLFAATVLLASASPAQDARAEVVAPVRYKLSYSRPGWVEVPLALEDLPEHCRRATGVDVAAIYDRWMGPVR